MASGARQRVVEVAREEGVALRPVLGCAELVQPVHHARQVVADAKDDEVGVERALHEGGALDRRVRPPRHRVLPAVRRPKQQVGPHEDSAHAVATHSEAVSSEGGRNVPGVASEPPAVQEHEREEELPDGRVAGEEQLAAAHCRARRRRGERLERAAVGLPIVQQRARRLAIVVARRSLVADTAVVFMPASLYKPPSRRYGGGCSRRTQRPTACAEQAPSQASGRLVGAIRTARQD